MISLASNTVAWNDITYILTDIHNHARITIASVSRETRLTPWLAAIYVVVYLRAHANGRILILDK
ncbi:MAG: hypothetical protein OXG98_10600, partial [Gemmatimonadetes bacterium]|nr:hypothetical protein [Gemmatimonadota bacterium]